MLTSKSSWRHNAVHFFDIATSKGGPNVWWFGHFDFNMCFAPQRRALFQHLNFQKCSGAEAFCTFSLGNVLRTTMPCKIVYLSSPQMEPQNIGEKMENTQCFAIFHNFSTLLSSSFFCLFSSLTLPTSAFPSVHWPYCRKFDF